MLICAIFADLEDHRIERKNISLPRHNNKRYFDICSELNYNLEKLFPWTAQKLLGDINLKVVHMRTLLSSQVKMDKTWRLNLKKHLK